MPKAIIDFPPVHYNNAQNNGFIASGKIIFIDMQNFP